MKPSSRPRAMRSATAADAAASSPAPYFPVAALFLGAPAFGAAVFAAAFGAAAFEAAAFGAAFVVGAAFTGALAAAAAFGFGAVAAFAVAAAFGFAAATVFAVADAFGFAAVAAFAGAAEAVFVFVSVAGLAAVTLGRRGCRHGQLPPLAGQDGRRVDCLFELLSFEMQDLELSFQLTDVFVVVVVASADADERLEIGQALLHTLLAEPKEHDPQLPRDRSRGRPALRAHAPMPAGRAPGPPSRDPGSRRTPRGRASPAPPATRSMPPTSARADSSRSGSVSPACSAASTGSTSRSVKRLALE